MTVDGCKFTVTACNTSSDTVECCSLVYNYSYVLNLAGYHAHMEGPLTLSRTLPSEQLEVADTEDPRVQCFSFERPIAHA